MFLDIRTVIFLILISASAASVAMLLVARYYPGGVGQAVFRWGLGCGCVALSYLLFALRGVVPDYLSVIFGNGFSMAAVGFFYGAVRALRGEPANWRLPLGFLATVVVSFHYYLLVDNDIAIRTLIVTLCAGVMLMIVGVEVARIRRPGRGMAIWLLSLAFFGTGLLFTLRGFMVLTGRDTPTAFLMPNPLQELSFLGVFLATVLGAIFFLLLAGEELTAELRRLATRDALTDIYNRRTFDELAGKTLARARRMGGSVALLVMDLDHFKEINDCYGHAAGDAALRLVAGTVAVGLRDQDVFARYGGEEFCVLLPDTEREQARQAAERVRRAIEDAGFAWNGEAARLTVSIGVAAQAGAELELEKLMQAADRAMYRAKETGRNRVEAA